MNTTALLQAKNSKFNEYLLKKRLERVSSEVLQNFLSELEIEVATKTKDNLTNAIVNHYKIMVNNAEFMSKFGDFVRDYVLGAGESEYLIEIPNEEGFISWINEWTENRFIGRKFGFYKNIYLELGEKYLSLDDLQNSSESVEGIDSKSSLGELESSSEGVKAIDSKSMNGQSKKYLSFPKKVFILVAYSHKVKSIFSKDSLVDIYPTFEFEVILRKNTRLVSVRGNYNVVRDFFSSAIEDKSNSLSMIESLFIGDFDSKKSRPIAQPRKTIDIEKLREALDGQYLDMDAPIPGDQATRVRFSFKGMRNAEEETHPVYGPAVVEACKVQEKSRIGFKYRDKSYAFSVTTNGGLFFRQFAPEEVITYILIKIDNLEES